MNKKYLLVMGLVIVVIGLLFYLRNDNERVTIKVMKEDITTNEEVVDKEKKVSVGEQFVLSDNDEYKDCGVRPSDIKILEINDNNVKISREVIRYKTDDKGKISSYTEIVNDVVNYNEKVVMYVNSKEQMAPVCGQARYNYYLVFVK